MGDYKNAKELYSKISLTDAEAKQYKSIVAIIETFINKDKVTEKIDDVIKTNPADEYIRFAILSFFQNNSNEIGKEETVKVKTQNGEQTEKINGVQIKTLTLNNEDLSEISFETESNDMKVSYYYQTMLEEISGNNITNLGIPGNMNGMYMQNNNMMNGNMMNNINPQNQDMMSNISNMWQSNSINNMYPSIYRIINPVVNRVVSNTNCQNLTNDSLNNMVDTVYNIVEGQIMQETDIEISRAVEDNNSVTNISTTSTVNSNSSTTVRTTSADNRNSNSTISNSGNSNNNRNNNINTNIGTNSRNNRNESLLKDLIKILIIKEILSRRQTRNQFYQNMQSFNNPYMNNQMNQMF